MEKQPKVIAHRGFSGKYPENTMIAFTKSVEVKAHMIELDIRISSDNQLIVIHDADLQRTTNGSGLVETLPVQQLLTYDAGSWLSPRFKEERLPLLVDVIRLCKAENMELNIEIKPTARREIVDLLDEMLQKENFLTGVIVSSFDISLLEALKLRNARIPCGYLVDKGDILEHIKTTEEKGFEAIHPRWTMVNETALTEAHRLGIAVNCWTVNLEEDMQGLIQLGVDGIITNYPELLLKTGLVWIDTSMQPGRD